MAGRVRILSLTAAIALLGTGIGLGAVANAAQTDVLLSQGHPATASGTRAGSAPADAVDGRTSTRWVSRSGGTQWIAVDLGAVHPIDRVRLLWDRACAKAYQIQTSPGDGVWTTVVHTGKGNGGVDDVTVTGTARAVRVLMRERCPHAPGTGYALRELQVYGPAPQPVPAPQHARSVEVTCTTATLTWDPPGTFHPAGVDAFRDGQLAGTAGPGATSITVTGLSPSTSYAFSLEFTDDAGDTSPPSATIAVTTPPCDDPLPPDPPTGVHATNVTSTCVTIAWNPAHDNVEVVGYRFYIDTALILQIPETSATVCGLAPATMYLFEVSAVDENGNESAKSPPNAVLTGGSAD